MTKTPSASDGKMKMTRAELDQLGNYLIAIFTPAFEKLTASEANDYFRVLDLVQSGRQEDIGTEVIVSLKARPYGRLVCPYCATTGAGPTMLRWHFDACARKYLFEQENFFPSNRDEVA